MGHSRVLWLLRMSGWVKGGAPGVLDTEWPTVKDTIISRLRKQRESASAVDLGGAVAKLGMVRLP